MSEETIYRDAWNLAVQRTAELAAKLYLFRHPDETEVSARLCRILVDTAWMREPPAPKEGETK